MPVIFVINFKSRHPYFAINQHYSLYILSSCDIVEGQDTRSQERSITDNKQCLSCSLSFAEHEAGSGIPRRLDITEKKQLEKFSEMAAPNLSLAPFLIRACQQKIFQYLSLRSRLLQFQKPKIKVVTCNISILQ